MQMNKGPTSGFNANVTSKNSTTTAGPAGAGSDEPGAMILPHARDRPAF